MNYLERIKTLEAQLHVMAAALDGLPEESGPDGDDPTAFAVAAMAVPVTTMAEMVIAMVADMRRQFGDGLS